MVDITIEILASSSITIRNGYQARFRIKTWWTHVDVPVEVTVVKLARLPMIQPYLVMTGKDTTIYVETWECCEDAGESREGAISPRSSFLGMTTCLVDEQLKNTNLNPTIKWLPIYNPIDNVMRGKLLLKVDAKFAFPTNPGEREGDDTSSGHKMMQGRISPTFQNSAFLIPPSNFHFDSSPTKHSIISGASRKSDLSSVSSSRSQEQGCQTDLSLPVLPDISKFTSALKLAEDGDEKGSSSYSKSPQRRQFSERQRNSKFPLNRSPSGQSVVDPLQLAQELLLKGTSSTMHNHRRNSDSSSSASASVSGGSSRQRASSDGFRRTCLVKQTIQHQYPHPQDVQTSIDQNRNDDEDAAEKNIPFTKEMDYDVESIDFDVIDILNNDRRHSALDSPDNPSRNEMKQRKNSSEVQNHKISSKPPLPKSNYSRSQDREENNNDNETGSGTLSDVSVRRLAPEARSSALGKERLSSPFRLPGQIGTTEGAKKDEEGYQNGRRFREIHFDGEKAKEQALIMAQKTSQPTTQAVPHPPVMRRRIAAAIFND